MSWVLGGLLMAAIVWIAWAPRPKWESFVRPLWPDARVKYGVGRKDPPREIKK